jgi:hypothetical protein
MLDKYDDLPDLQLKQKTLGIDPIAYKQQMEADERMSGGEYIKVE